MQKKHIEEKCQEIATVEQLREAPTPPPPEFPEVREQPCASFTAFAAAWRPNFPIQFSTTAALPANTCPGDTNASTTHAHSARAHATSNPVFRAASSCPSCPRPGISSYRAASCCFCVPLVPPVRGPFATPAYPTPLRARYAAVCMESPRAPMASELRQGVQVARISDTSSCPTPQTLNPEPETLNPKP